MSGLKDLLKAEAQIFSFQREAELRIAQQSVELLQNYDKFLRDKIQNRLKLYSKSLSDTPNASPIENSKFEQKLSDILRSESKDALTKDLFNSPKVSNNLKNLKSSTKIKKV